MTQTICTIFLHAATLRLSYRSIKSLRRLHHLQHHNKNHHHHHHHHHDDNDHHNDPSILKLWSLIAIHAVYTQSGIEFLLSFIPFYYYIKLLAMITIILNVDGVFHLLVKGIDTLHYILDDVTFYTKHLYRKVGGCLIRWRDESVMILKDLPRRGVYVCWSVLLSDEEEWERVYQLRTRQIEEVRKRTMMEHCYSGGIDDDKGVGEVDNDDDGVCRQDESGGDGRDVDKTVDDGGIVEENERDDEKISDNIPAGVTEIGDDGRDVDEAVDDVGIVEENERDDEKISDNIPGRVAEIDDDGVCRQDESGGDSRDVDETVDNGVSVDETDRDDAKEYEKIIDNTNEESDKEEKKREIIPSNMETEETMSYITKETTEAPKTKRINWSNSLQSDEAVNEIGMSVGENDRDDAEADDKINDNMQEKNEKEADVISSNILETVDQKQSLISKQTTETNPEKKSINSSSKSLQKVELLESTKSSNISSNNKDSSSTGQSLQTLSIIDSPSSVDDLSLLLLSPSQKISSTTTTTPSTESSSYTTVTTTTTNPSHSSSSGTYQKTTTSSPQQSKTIPPSPSHDPISISTHSNITTTTITATSCDDFPLLTPLLLSSPKTKKKKAHKILNSRLSSVFSPVAQSRVMASALNLRRFQKTHAPSSHVVRQPLLSTTENNVVDDDDDDDQSVASTIKSYITGSSRIRMRDYLFDLDLPVSYNKLTTPTAHATATTMAQRRMTTAAVVAKSSSNGNSSNDGVVNNNAKQQQQRKSSFLRRVTFKNR